MKGDYVEKGQPVKIEWNLLNRAFAVDVHLSPIQNMLVSDIVPTAISFCFTALIIYMNGYWGVLDLDNRRETCVYKSAGESVRINLDQDYSDIHEHKVTVKPTANEANQEEGKIHYPRKQLGRDISLKLPTVKLQKHVSFAAFGGGVARN